VFLDAIKKMKSTPFTKHQKLFVQKHKELEGRQQAFFSQWVDRERVKKAVEFLRTIEYVPTIFRKEEPDRIGNFYYVTKVVRKQHNGYKATKELIVECYDDFKTDKAIIVEGTVGQGKSILLRYLHNKELNKGVTLPIFIELKDADSNIPIKDLIIEFIHESLGLRCDEELFDTLLDLGLFSFFFDGFDEVEYKDRADLVQFISWINNRCAHSRIIVTSRPGNEVQQVQGFEIFSICPLNEEEQIKFVNKLIHNYENVFQQDYLLRNIDSLSIELRKILGSPLVLTLFSMVYRNKVKVPESHSEFYQKLFDTLVSEHDGLKVGFTRPTKSNVRADDLKLILENVAYSLMIKRESTKEGFKLLIRHALSELSLTAEPEKVLYDLTKNTCLIQLDNHKYRFIHENIECYFAASYLKNNADDDDAKEFYETCRDKWSKWYDVLLFLKDIDKIRYCRFFYKKELEGLFEKKLLPKFFRFTKSSSLIVAKNISYIEVEMHDSDDITVVDTHSLIVLMPETNFIFKKDFRQGAYPYERSSNKKVNLSKAFNSIGKRIKEVGRSRQREFKELIEANCTKRKDDSVMIRVIALDVVIEEFELEDWFLSELNKIPLDGLKSSYKDLLTLLDKKQVTKEKGRFTV